MMSHLMSLGLLRVFSCFIFSRVFILDDIAGKMKVAGQRITKRDILVLFIFGMVFQAMLQFVLPGIDDRGMLFPLFQLHYQFNAF